MNISALRNKIEIWQRTGKENPYGEIVYTWQATGTEWAEVRSIPGDEFRDQVFTYSKVPYRVMIRYREGLDATMIIRNLSDGMFMNIEAIRDPDGKREILELQCLWREDQTTPK